MQNATFHQYNIFYGAQFTASNVNAFTQNVGHTINSDVTRVMDSRNNAIARVNSNPNETCTFKFYSFDVNSAAGNGAVQWIDTGVMFTVTGPTGCGPVTGSNWVCDSINFDYTYNQFAEVTINASRNPAITT